MSLTTVTIAAIDYTSYATLAEADARLAVDPIRSAAWSALSDDDKLIRLVAATNRLDLLDWAGEKAGGPTQENAWYRTGVAYKDGTAVGDAELPKEVENATILLAGTIASTPAAAGAGTSGSNEKRLKAGSAEIEFFRPTLGVALQDETAFRLVQCFLAGQGAQSGSTGNAASGTGAESTFKDDYLGYGIDQGFS